MANNGRQQEWREWVELKGPRFLLFARQQTSGEADAKDVFQEAVLKIWKRHHREGGLTELPPDPEVFLAIRQSAIDMARRNQRRIQREQSLLQDCPTDHGPWFEPLSKIEEDHAMLRLTLKSIDPKYQEVLTLKVWGELSFREIAQVLGLPPNTVASRYRYALQALKRKLEISQV